MIGADAELRMEGICKTFPGVQALKDISFDVKRGEIHALVGHNGAGKSTLLKILAGIYQADKGEIVINGEILNRWNPHLALDHGISFIYQELNLVQEMTVAHNIMLGREPKNKLGLIDWKKLYSRSQEALNRISASEIDIHSHIRDLGVATQQIVAIARAIDQGPSFLVLDEPTSRLGMNDIDRLFQVLKQMKRERIGIIYVSHRLDEIYRISDRITVLRDGNRVLVSKTKDLPPDQLVENMLGDRINNIQLNRGEKLGEEILKTQDLIGPGVNGVNLTLHKGEVLGLVGAVGAGKTELVQLLFGIKKPVSGKITIDGKLFNGIHSSEAIKSGVALCPENRKEQGLLLDSSIRENITLVGLKRFLLGNLFPIRFREEIVVKELVDRLRIKSPSLKKKAKTLSGGNQQKVVLAKWLCTNSQVFIFDEPTVGVDIRGKTEIYDLMYELAHQGAGILFVTSDIEEGLKLCNEIQIMFRGKIVKVLKTNNSSIEEASLFAMGGQPLEENQKRI